MQTNNSTVSANSTLTKTDSTFPSSHPQQPAAKRSNSATTATATERKKGVPWTEEEHRLFLQGLAMFGQGNWRSIARTLVLTRTPTQVRNAD